MKKFAALLLTLVLVVGLLFSTLTASAASTRPSPTDHAWYENFHSGHRSHLSSARSSEDYDATWESYRKERRALYEEELKKDVKDGYLTQDEADLLLKDFDTMADYCGGHRESYRNSSSRTSRRYGHGGCCGHR